MQPSTETEFSHSSHKPDWTAIASSVAFRNLLRQQNRFIVPACAFFLVYYFALPLSVAYAPDLMKRPVLGPVNLAYAFALSQFVAAWLVAWFYARAARKWDVQREQIAREAKR